MSEKTLVAVCTRCGRSTDNWSLINQPCNFRGVKTGKCKGVYRSKLTPEEGEGI